ncbi:hypothetical protein ABZ470_21685 [Streptosporangium sp. NPDC020072]
MREHPAGRGRHIDEGEGHMKVIVAGGGGRTPRRTGAVVRP